MSPAIDLRTVIFERPAAMLVAIGCETGDLSVLLCGDGSKFAEFHEVLI